MRYEVVLIASNKHASARLTYVVDKHLNGNG